MTDKELSVPGLYCCTNWYQVLSKSSIPDSDDADGASMTDEESLGMMNVC